MRPSSVVVAGTAFGRSYLDAVRSAPESFTLAAILATGSDFSHALARAHQVPLCTEPAQVPEVDLACVVVGSGLLGGAGSRLAQAFLRRGIHVLQEHPVHRSEIADNLRVARDGDAAYAVHTLYPDVAPVRRFLAAAAAIRRTHRLRFVAATCGGQVAYPLIDVLGQAAGAIRPFRLDDPVRRDDGHPYRTVHGVLGGIPMTLHIQNQLDPADPDNHAFLLHRITLGSDAGVLTLADTHGPVLWQPRLHARRDGTGRLILAGPGTERLAAASMVDLGPEPVTYHEVFARVWPAAVLRALHRLRAEAAEPARRARSGQWALSVSTAWAELTERLGPAEHIHPDEPPVLPVPDLLAAVEDEERSSAR